MASSLVTTECKRYGCMKNLLACFANCRYNTRCEELKNELVDKTDLATRDINQYLFDRGRKPIVIQTMKRGLRFVEATKAEKAAPFVKQIKEPSDQPRGMKAVEATKIEKAASLIKLKQQPSKQKRRLRLVAAKAAPVTKQREDKAAPVIKPREKVVMPKRAKNEASALREEKPVANHHPAQASDMASSMLKPIKPSRAKNKNGARKSRAAAQRRKIYIILEGKSASIVTEQGLMQHLFNNPGSGARYFEASEVEARVQIVLK
jgi:hypothetical protein